ncbi:MAG TPA: ATP-binding protein [Gammaproteobacteria bacterium]|nr:ATP-binding protein [Gammaproteobacteria bacterium]
MPLPEPLPITRLYQRCDVDALGFDTTAELADLEEIIGQQRAMDAVQFGVRMPGDGYNLYVLGPAETDKESVVRKFLERESAGRQAPGDWTYLNNFSDPKQPRALGLPSGRGAQLRADMQHLVEELKTSIPAAFETEDYRNRRAEIEEEFNEHQQRALREVQEAAEKEHMTLIQTPHGFAIAPTRDGQVLPQKEFEQLPDEEKQRIEGTIGRLSELLRRNIEQFPRWFKERKEREKALDREVTMSVVGLLLHELRERHGDLPEVLAYLDEVQTELVDSAQDFMTSGEESNPMLEMLGGGGRRSLNRFSVNLLVDRSGAAGAPVVYEPNPSYQNLMGRVEHLSQFGALTTDFSMIRAGALHRANGGYLILNVERVLTQPYAWESLKRALYGQEIRIESLGQMLSLVSTVSLEPQPVPLEVKVVLLGDRRLYYLLYALDPDFGELFKVAADFEDDMDRTPEATRAYGKLIATMARHLDLRPLHRDAVARLIEHSARLTEDARKLSMHTGTVRDLLREADHWAAQGERDVVGAGDVAKAIDMRVERLARVRDRVREAIRRGTLLIDTEGSAVGQVNGLSVMQLGDLTFGQPSRITATARLGSGEVVDIEREAKLGGRLHSKGVLILSSLLAARYASDRPLSLAASLVFEQSYGGVDGDSASVGEFCALLSALSGLALKQSLAITGSVNQLGRVQAIGGVNEKIEGFFDVCAAGGLTGEQGVLIPADNIQHLMLRADVVEAAGAERFRIYPVTTVDQAVALLTGVEAGARDASGRYPPGTVNARVERRLHELAEKRRKFGDRHPQARDEPEGDEE